MSTPNPTAPVPAAAPPPSDTVMITVDGVPMKAKKGEMLIRVTDANDVYVPRFCYHEKLAVAANCRMCLVEVEKAPKPLPACATPVMDGMIVHTRSAKAIAAQKSVMEFLLINHPLDCPICDQGGECELQDLAVGYGRDVSRYAERKRVVKDKNIGPLVSTDMTRCIHCTRCVRFSQDITGAAELGTTSRGEHNEIGTYVEKAVEHELSGNIIDLCPVGALNSKPFRYRARSWEMSQVPLVSPHDGLGTNTYGHVLRGRLMRVVPRANDAINECWISDRDRFSYEGIYSADRLEKPMLRMANGAWKEVDWQTALEAAVQGLKGVAAGSLGVLAGPSSTLEEYALLQQLAAGLGTPNIDHRLRQLDFSGDAADPALPTLGGSIAEVDTLQALLVVGSNLRLELPLLAHRVRKAARAGARVAFLNPAQFEYHFEAEQIVVDPAAQLAELNALVAAAGGSPVGGAMASITDRHRKVAESLRGAQRKAIWLGALAIRHPQYAALRAAAQALATTTVAGCARRGWQRRRRPPRRRAAASRRGLRRADRPGSRCGRHAVAVAGRLSAVGYGTRGGLPARKGARLAQGSGLRGRSHTVCDGRTQVRGAGAVAHRQFRRDLRHLREPGRPVAELRGRGAARGRIAPGLEGAARARQPAGLRGLRAELFRGSARPVACPG
jgi:NADH-quinone oxidoreductase subunit G